MTLIAYLKDISPQERACFLQERLKKNKQFFFHRNKMLYDHLCQDYKKYKIIFTKSFLKIKNGETDELIHPQSGLDKWSEMLGGWTHNAWVDLVDLNPTVRMVEGNLVSTINKFNTFGLKEFSFYLKALGSKEIHIFDHPADSTKRISPNTVFVGLGPALHVDYYLEHTWVHKALFVEPDFDLFALSCCFLDWQALDERFDGLMLSVGEGFPEAQLDYFMANTQATSAVWMRVLPGYATEKNEPIIRRLKNKWHSLRDNWFPYDDEIQSYINVKEHIDKNHNCLKAKKALTKGSRVVVLGAGPSLTHDLPWVQENRDKFILCACHSTIRILRQWHIEPDFQFDIEMWWSHDKKEKLQMYSHVPLVCNIKIPVTVEDDFDSVYYFHECAKNAPVRFDQCISYSHPTTGNWALAFAAFFEPAEIYLLGMDLGFRDAQKTHYSGSWYDESENAHKNNMGTAQSEVAPNFYDAEPVFTRPYFNEARFSIERLVAARNQKIVFYNTSDGARIKGARPCRTEKARLVPYPDKEADIDAIKSCFGPLAAGDGFTSHTTSGSEVLVSLKEHLLEHLALAEEDRTMDRIIQTLDGAYLSLCRFVEEQEQGDTRFQPYLLYMNDLLSVWFRYLVAAQSYEAIAQVYDVGLNLLRQALDEVYWPLDEDE